jgi:hypothetical protein
MLAPNAAATLASGIAIIRAGLSLFDDRLDGSRDTVFHFATALFHFMTERLSRRLAN